MFGSTRRRSYRNWPRVREREDGLQIAGSCLTAAGWAGARRTARASVVWAGMFLIAVSTLALWGPGLAEATEGTRVFPWIGRIASIQWAVRDLLVDRYPEIGRSIGYRVPTPIDWHMGGLGFLLVVAREPLSVVGTKLVAFLLRPLFTKRFRVYVTPGYVRIGGRVLGRSYSRGAIGLDLIKFRSVGPEEYFADAGSAEDEPPRRVPAAVVEMIYGFDRHRIVFARRADQAEAIVRRCNAALLQTQSLRTDLS